MVYVLISVFSRKASHSILLSAPEFPNTCAYARLDFGDWL